MLEIRLNFLVLLLFNLGPCSLTIGLSQAIVFLFKRDTQLIKLLLDVGLAGGLKVRELLHFLNVELPDGVFQGIVHSRLCCLEVQLWDFVHQFGEILHARAVFFGKGVHLFKIREEHVLAVGFCDLVPLKKLVIALLLPQLGHLFSLQTDLL